MTIDLPADLTMLDSKLIDGVVERLFDRLGQCEIVVRVGFPQAFPHSFDLPVASLIPRAL